MKDKGGLHLKVQEFCDCYASTDFLREMSVVKAEPDKEEGALKWLALAVLHGVNDNAKKISITRASDGQVKVVAKYRSSELPTPGAEVAGKIFETVKGITHMEGDKGSLPLALGIRDSSLEVVVNMDRGEEGETISIEFPK